MNQENSSVISAEAILKSKTGRSLARDDVQITPENIEEFAPAAETVAEAAKRLRDLGFSVTESEVTLTLTGTSAQFEDVFKVKLTIKEDKSTGSVTVQPEGKSVIPNALRDIVEEVVFPEPPEYFP